MINFKQFYEDIVNTVTIAVLPGSFKPPTKGHFAALENLLQSADKGVVFIGSSSRDGIDQEMSYQIWNIYVPYFSKPVRIEKCISSPVTDTYKLVEENKDINFIVGVGPEDDEEEGKKPKKPERRYDSFKKNPEKYPNVTVIDIPLSGGGIRGTPVRDMILSKDPKVGNYFGSGDLSETDRERIKNILNI